MCAMSSGAVGWEGYLRPSACEQSSTDPPGGPRSSGRPGCGRSPRSDSRSPSAPRAYERAPATRCGDHERCSTSTSARPAAGATGEWCRASRGLQPGITARVPTDDRVLPGAAAPGHRDVVVDPQDAPSADDALREETRSYPRVHAVATRTAPPRRTATGTRFEIYF